MNAKVSIIIPSFNVEKYIFRAIESCLSQTYKNIEIVLIDDGSTDQTFEIESKYKKIDSRIITFKQDNKGVSCARNMGLSICSGDYIIFLDSDDWIENNTIEELIEFQKNNPESFIVTDRYFVIQKNDLSIEKKAPNSGKKDAKISKDQFILRFCNHDFNLQSSCYKIYKKSIIDKHNIRFNEKIYHGEDGLFVFTYMMFCDFVYYFNCPLWNIFDRDGSATKSPYNKKWLTAIDAAQLQISGGGLNKKEIKYLKKYYVERSLMVHSAMLMNDDFVVDNDYFYVCKCIKQYPKEYLIGNNAKAIVYYLASFLPIFIKKGIIIFINNMKK